jgi:hypothetical protein
MYLKLLRITFLFISRLWLTGIQKRTHPVDNAELQRVYYPFLSIKCAKWIWSSSYFRSYHFDSVLIIYGFKIYGWTKETSGQHWEVCVSTLQPSPLPSLRDVGLRTVARVGRDICIEQEICTSVRQRDIFMNLYLPENACRQSKYGYLTAK